MIVTGGKTVLDFLPQLEKALALTNTHGVEDVRDKILRGDAQLWVRGDGMIVTEIIDYPQLRVLQFWLAAGTLDDVLELAEEAYAWGESIGCTRAAFLGRRGWAKPLVEHGWEESNLRYFTKELTDGAV